MYRIKYVKVVQKNSNEGSATLVITDHTEYYLILFVLRVECEAGELLDELGGRAGLLRAGAPLPAGRLRLLAAYS